MARRPAVHPSIPQGERRGDCFFAQIPHLFSLRQQNLVVCQPCEVGSGMPKTSRQGAKHAKEKERKFFAPLCLCVRTRAADMTRPITADKALGRFSDEPTATRKADSVSKTEPAYVNTGHTHEKRSSAGQNQRVRRAARLTERFCPASLAPPFWAG